MHSCDVTAPRADEYLRQRGLRVSVWPRFFLYCCSVAFAVVLNYAHESYLYPVHEFWGFPYFQLGSIEWFFLLVAICCVCIALPLQIIRPSALVLFLLYIFVFLPSIVITLAAKPDALFYYCYELIALVFGFCGVGVVVRMRGWSSWHGVRSGAPSGGGRIFIVLVWSVLFIFVLLAFRDVIGFVGLDDIYQQREAGRAKNAIEAYAQTYLAFVISPAVFAIGICRRNFTFLVLGFLGFMLMFAVTAERTIFLFPFAMAGLYFFVRPRMNSAFLVSWMILLFTIIILVSISFDKASRFFDLLATYFVFRVVAVPGSMFWQYSDVFAELGRTYWSNVTGLSLIVDVPVRFSSEPSWPQLGYLVADEILHLKSNSNANLFAYDGVAAAGAIGVLVASLILGSWLVVLDRVTRSADPMFVMLVTFPMAFSLTNGSVFSLMLSFGGFFWVAFFAISTRCNRVV